jgi:peptidoglycan/LPS O-acetylase OafA/YrhL
MTLVSGLTSIVIAFLSIPKIQVIDFFANLSYCFYLIHVPVGGRAIKLGTRLGSDLYLKFMVLGVALISSVYAAFSLYKFLELPCQTWNKKLQTNGDR